MKAAIHVPSALVGAAALGLVFGLTSLMQVGGKLRRVPTLSPEAMEILAHFSIVQLPDGQGGFAKSIRLSAADFQLVNGLGATNGFPADPMTTAPTATQTNGLGNLALGYDEVAGVEPIPFRTGSHNLVLGVSQDTTSFGGLLGGRGNAVTAPYGSSVGGEGNLVSGAFSAILGGEGNTAGPGDRSAIGGGADNRTVGDFSFVGGGSLNTALGDYAAVGGAHRGIPPSIHDWVAGGLLEDQ